MKKTLTIILLGLFFLSVKAQVTIGTGEEPIAGALLQLKSIDNITDDTKNAYKGLALPRVTLSDKNQLYPMFLNSPDDPTSGPDAAYQADKPGIDKSHTGLIVYNLTGDDDKELCLGLNQWDGEKWNCFQQKMGNAVLEITECDSVNIYGQYKNNVSLTSANYITLPLRVTKPGAYTITVAPDPDNGYYFSTSGAFLVNGYYYISVPGAGMPKNFTPSGGSGDQLKITFNGKPVDTCPLNLKIEDSSTKPLYVMDCSKTQVIGKYYEEQRLDQSHYIELTLNVDPSAMGARYEISTNEVDGIKFSGSGILSASPQVVRIYGEGVPFGNQDKKFYIKTNSESSSATCVATVFVIIPPKKILSIGRHTAPGYCIGAPGTVSNNMITDSKNFGPDGNSIVRYAGFTNAGKDLTSNYLEFNLANQKQGRTIYAREGGYFNDSSRGLDRLSLYLKGTTEAGETVSPVDIVYIGWTGVAADAGDWIPTTAQMALLKEYLERGGIVIVNNENNNFNRAFLRGIFANTGINMKTGLHNPAGSVYKMDNIQTDPVLNGPFGNIAGLFWGEDASTTVYAINLPVEDVLLYSNNKNEWNSTSTAEFGAATLFRHRTLPLIWSGDGGFSSGYNSDPVLTYYPFKTGSKTINGTTYTNYPISKKYSGGYSVSNSIFTANALAWCIRTADELKRKNR